MSVCMCMHVCMYFRFTVGSSNSRDEYSSFSLSGPCVDLAAPVWLSDRFKFASLRITFPIRS